MKIELDTNLAGLNKIDAYSPGALVIANNRYTSSLIVSPQKIISDWPPDDISELTLKHTEQIISLSPEVVLLGTGGRLIFPDSKLSGIFSSREIGFEVMDTGAACRSYNILLSEGRRVVAALFVIRESPDNKSVG